MNGEGLANHIERLSSSLHRLSADRKAAGDEGCSQGVIDERDRFAAHQSLVTVIGFLNSQPEWASANIDFALRRLLISLANINEGRTEGWLTNPGQNAPPLGVEVQTGRGRCAGVTELLMRAHLTREASARFVVENLSVAAIKRLAPQTTRSGPNWKRVAGWRDNVRKAGNSQGSDALVDGYGLQLAIAVPPGKSVQEVCRASLVAVARMLAMFG